MPANPDFKDLFKLLKEEAVEYLVVGAHAEFLSIFELHFKCYRSIITAEAIWKSFLNWI